MAVNRYSFWLLLLLFPVIAFAQDDSTEVKGPPELTVEDTTALIDYARHLFRPQPQVGLFVSPADIAPPAKALKPEKPATQTMVDSLESLLGLDPVYDSQLYLELGLAHQRLRNHKKAVISFKTSVDILDKVLLRKTDSAELYAMRAEAYYHLRKPAEVIFNCEQTLRLEPDHEDARLRLPTMYFILNNYPRAREAIREVLDRDSMAVEFYLLSCNLDIGECGLDTAAKIHTQAWRNLPIDSIFDLKEIKQKALKYPDHYRTQLAYHLVKHYYLFYKLYLTADEGQTQYYPSKTDQNDLKELMVFYKSALKNPAAEDHYMLYFGIGNCYALQNNFKKAAGWFRKAIEARPVSKSNQLRNAALAYDALIACHYLTGNKSRALEILEEKIEVKPEIDPQTHDKITLAQMQLAVGNQEASTRACYGAISGDSYEVGAYTGLTISSLAEGDLSRAEAHLNTVHTLSPDQLSSQGLFGVLLLLKGNYSTARYVFSKIRDRGDIDEESKAIIQRYFPDLYEAGQNF